jgi:hypothetical protein
MINLREISFAVVHNTQCQVFLVYNQEKLKTKNLIVINISFEPLADLLTIKVFAVHIGAFSVRSLFGHDQREQIGFNALVCISAFALADTEALADTAVKGCCLTQ